MSGAPLQIADEIRGLVRHAVTQSQLRPSAVMVPILLREKLQHDSALDPAVRFDAPTSQWYIDGLPITLSADFVQVTVVGDSSRP